MRQHVKMDSEWNYVNRYETTRNDVICLSLERNMDKKLLDDVVAKLRCKDATLATQVLNEAFTNNDQEKVLLALREMSEAFGGVKKLAEQVGTDPDQLDHQLSRNGDPLICHLTAILKGMGMQLRVRAIQ